MLKNIQCLFFTQGRVYEDMNSNCLFDAGDLVKAYTVVHLLNGTSSITDANGMYQLEVDTGNYSWRVYPARWQQTLCPSNNMYQTNFTTLGNKLLNQDFAMHSDSVFDLRVSYYAFRKCSSW